MRTAATSSRRNAARLGQAVDDRIVVGAVDRDHHVLCIGSAVMVVDLDVKRQFNTVSIAEEVDLVAATEHPGAEVETGRLFPLCRARTAVLLGMLLRQRSGSITERPVRSRYHAVSFRCGKSSFGTGISRKRQIGSQPSPGW